MGKEILRKEAFIMKVTYDKEADALYIYVVKDIKEAHSVRQQELNENIILDFDKNDNIIGIEILDAKEILDRLKEK